jgi:hypothetical protein
MSAFSRRAVGGLIMAASLMALIGPSSAQGPEGLTRDPKQLVQALRSGGYVIVVRHGATFSDQADSVPIDFNDISKQRNLNQRARIWRERSAKQSARSASRLVKFLPAISIARMRRQCLPDSRMSRRQST